MRPVDDDSDGRRVESGDVDDIVPAVAPIEVTRIRVKGNVVEDKRAAMLTGM